MDPAALVLTLAPAVGAAVVAALLDVAVVAAAGRERAAGRARGDLDTHLTGGLATLGPAVSFAVVILVDPRSDVLQVLATVLVVPVLVVAALVDLHVHRIPDVVTAPAAVAGLAVGLATCLRAGSISPGIAAVTLSATLVAVSAWWPAGLGMGDAKLLGSLVLLVLPWGPGAPMATVLVSLTLSGAAAALAMALGTHRGWILPAGPFIAVGTTGVLIALA